MKHIFLIATALAAISTPVLSADYQFSPQFRTTVDAPVTQITKTSSYDLWNGPYAGVTVGYGWDKLRASVNGSDLGYENYDGVSLGGFGGYNAQLSDNFVMGLEGDFEYAWNQNSYPVLNGLNVDTGVNWSSSLRGRIGVAAGRALFYGTAGVALSHFYADLVSDVGINKTMVGYTVGAGMDYAFTDNVFGRLEYRYTGYPDSNIADELQSLADLNVKANMNSNVVRVGLGVKF